MPTVRVLLISLLAGALVLGCGVRTPVRTALPTPTTAPTPVATPVARAVVTPTPIADPAPSTPGPVIGNDISWPECPIGTVGALPKRPGKGLPLPGPTAHFAVIGLTNGPGFYPNPCLAWQVQQVRQRHLAIAAYAFTTMPNASQVAAFGRTGPWSAATPLGRMQNASYAEATINIASMRTAGLRTPIVWIDVEPQDYLGPWGTDVATNRAVIRAVQRAYGDYGYRTGLYSSDTPWKRITGGMRDSGPVWVTVGPRGRAAAVATCSAPTFSGGPALLAQWWDDEIQDKDLICPETKASSLFEPAS